MDPLCGPIRQELEAFEQSLDAALQADVSLAHRIARYMATLRGKRLRPCVTLLGARATGRWDERVVEAAVAVEMVHAATMIHDDVVDSATVRRGKASVNEAWSGQLAVLMGDFLLARALSIVVDLGDLQALRLVSRATERLSIGEIFEIQIGQDGDTSEASYLRMVSDKTASLLSAAARLGAILVGAPAQTVAALGQYGENLGMAFQIADDILDFTGDAGTLGKPVGQDLQEGKITLPLIHALCAASQAERQEMQHLLRREGKGELDWHRIVDFVGQHGGVAAARATARQYATRAQECLQPLRGSPAREALEVAARLVVERQS
ncbi:MAG: polyprenyl synthetase family protein [Candidatus Latescibacterota bacterium]